MPLSHNLLNISTGAEAMSKARNEMALLEEKSRLMKQAEDCTRQTQKAEVSIQELRTSLEMKVILSVAKLFTPRKQ